MTETDLFGVYVRRRLDAWGEEFAYHRDREYRSPKHVLQVLQEHKGQPPGRQTGSRSLYVDMEAMQIEDMVRELFKQNRVHAWALRAYHCGSGRRMVERFDFFRAAVGRGIGKAGYCDAVKQGQDWIRAALLAVVQPSQAEGVDMETSNAKLRASCDTSL